MTLRRSARSLTTSLVLASLITTVPFASAQPKKGKPPEKTPSTAKAPDRKACIQSFEDAQTSRKSGKLADAADHLALCSHEKCPEITRKPCTQWKAEWEGAMPRLSIEIVDANGAAIPDAKLVLDGQPENGSSRRDLRVDPGSHTVVAILEGRGEQRTTVTLAEGGAGTARLVFPVAAPTASAAPTQTPPPDTAKPSRFATAPKATYVFGALGVIGLATFAIAGSSGRKDQDDLKTGCAPRCNPADKDEAARKFVIADVGLVVGAASLGVATYLLLRKRPEPTTAGATGSQLRFDVSTQSAGATGVLSGRF